MRRRARPLPPTSRPGRTPSSALGAEETTLHLRAEGRQGHAGGLEAVHGGSLLLPGRLEAGREGGRSAEGHRRGQGGRAGELAAVPRAGRDRRRRRAAPADHLGREGRDERPLEDADPRPGPLLPGRLGRPRVPHHGRQAATPASAPATTATRPRSTTTSKHTWQVLCLDRDTGKILWTKTAFEGVPKIKRHLKGSQANCTAGDRRQARRRLLRLGGAVLLRLRRQAALEARPRHARFQLRARPAVRVGLRPRRSSTRTASSSSAT